LPTDYGAVPTSVKTPAPNAAPATGHPARQ
jgi:hypothetical protein